MQCWIVIDRAWNELLFVCLFVCSAARIESLDKHLMMATSNFHSPSSVWTSTSDCTLLSSSSIASRLEDEKKGFARADKIGGQLAEIDKHQK